MNGTGYQEALFNDLAKYNIAAAGITEMTEARLPGHEQRTIVGATVLHSGGAGHILGVALVLRPPLSDLLVSWNAISPRLLYARLLHRQDHLSLIVVYIPQKKTTLRKRHFL